MGTRACACACMTAVELQGHSRRGGSMCMCMCMRVYLRGAACCNTRRAVTARHGAALALWRRRVLLRVRPAVPMHAAASASCELIAARAHGPGCPSCCFAQVSVAAVCVSAVSPLHARPPSSVLRAACWHVAAGQRRFDAHLWPRQRPLAALIFLPSANVTFSRGSVLCDRVQRLIVRIASGGMLQQPHGVQHHTAKSRRKSMAMTAAAAAAAAVGARCSMASRASPTTSTSTSRPPHTRTTATVAPRRPR